jgi:hypothetical protein
VDRGGKRVVRLGVTGHRPAGLKRANSALLSRRVDRALDAVARAACSRRGEARPQVRVLSALAEGADRIVAERALQQDCELQCVLPFARQSYELDFRTSASRQAYNSLLDRASETTALAGKRGSREQRESAYEAVGRAILDQSDVMLAIWNGAPAAGRGGTGQIVRESKLRGVPDRATGRVRMNHVVPGVAEGRLPWMRCASR